MTCHHDITIQKCFNNINALLNYYCQITICSETHFVTAYSPFAYPIFPLNDPKHL